MESRIPHIPARSEAWMTLVLGMDLSYVGAAIVLASSLKRKKTRGELVCMVTPDVPKEARQHLQEFFDYVVEVPYLQTLALQKYSGRFDAMYNYWLDKSFTKFALFGLVEYKKVVFLDADMLPLENPDALFDCPTPAGICSSVKGTLENEKLHGMPLPRMIIEESLKNGQGHYGVRGCLLVFKPDMEVYKTLRSKVESVEKYGSLESMVGPDEYLITRHFIDEWHHVHAKYGWVSWADRQDLGVDPCFLHYVSQKPWEEGESWEDFKYWKEEAKEVVQRCPQMLIYFSHIAKTLAEMANVDYPTETEEKILELRRISNERKQEEKNRRLEAAKEANIDLTEATMSSTSSIVSGKKSDFSSAPNSARATIFPRSTPTVCVNPPMSARGIGDSQRSDQLLVKVNPNILVVNGYKRPAGAKPKEKTKPKNGSNKGKKATATTSKTQETNPQGSGVGVKPSVPKLNLNSVNGNEEGSGNHPGGKGGSTWSGHHWKRHSDISETHSSRADVQTDWRLPSGRGTNSNNSPSLETLTMKCQSARNWPNTPTSGNGGSKSARRKENLTRKEQTPRSSRADLSSNWRSTPQQSPVRGEWKSSRFHQEVETPKAENVAAAIHHLSSNKSSPYTPNSASVFSTPTTTNPPGLDLLQP